MVRDAEDLIAAKYKNVAYSVRRRLPNHQQRDRRPGERETHARSLLFDDLKLTPPKGQQSGRRSSFCDAADFASAPDDWRCVTDNLDEDWDQHKREERIWARSAGADLKLSQGRQGPHSKFHFP